jgi:DNA ligase-1
MSDFKPMLAGKFDATKAVFPLLASPKLDGIRCCIHQGLALTRSLKEIPNKHIFTALSAVHLEGLDGELIVGEPSAHDVYRVTSSAVMSHEGEPLFKYYVFDNFNSSGGFEKRTDIARQMAQELPSIVEWLPQHLVTSLEQFTSLEDEFLAQGFEGIMARSLDGPYKYGRSTTREGWLLKKKNFEDSEFVIDDFEELMHNDNAAFENELGRTARSKAQDGLRGGGVLGAFIGRDLHTNIPFKIGTGFDAAFRKWAWEHREELRGAIGVYKSFRIGVKDAPRHPVWKWFRDKRDMS